MNQRNNPLYWSFSIGTWFLTPVRVSYFFPLLAILVCYQLHDLQLGLIVTGILFASILAHEFGHILAARNTGGFGEEILIWPLGGLAFAQPGTRTLSRIMTPAAGPLVNGVICLACLPAVLNSGLTREALNPFILVPNVTFQGRILLDLLVLTFALNWFLLLVNLLPVHPLDGGRLLQVLLSARFGGEMAAQICIRVALVVGSALFFGALMYESVWVMAIGSFILLQNVLEMQQQHQKHGFDDSFMGYDFSQGYTSLEREEASATRRRPGLLERWREQRRQKRELRNREEEQEAALQMDALLAKVHEQGIEALTDAERRMLDRMSARFRNRERSSE